MLHEPSAPLNSADNKHSGHNGHDSLGWFGGDGGAPGGEDANDVMFTAASARKAANERLGHGFGVNDTSS